MKNLTLVIGGIILLLNLIIGMIFSAYKPFNVGLNSAVIIAKTLIFYSLGAVHIKDGFKISLVFLFFVIAAIEYILVFFVPRTWGNNIALTILILLFVSQIILFVIAFFISKIG